MLCVQIGLKEENFEFGADQVRKPPYSKQLGLLGSAKLVIHHYHQENEISIYFS